jgi:hypothetical protein
MFPELMSDLPPGRSTEAHAEAVSSSAPGVNWLRGQSHQGSTSERQEATHLPGQFFLFTAARRPDIL